MRRRVYPNHSRTVADYVLESATVRAAEQTAQYGHDTGYFTLGREESSHEIGCRGELIVRDFFREVIGPPADVRLTPLGHPTDLEVLFNGQSIGIHVKSGLYRTLPSLNQPFGVHFAQRLEMSGAALVLVSLLRNDVHKAVIEGFLEPHELHAAPILRKGETFPGRTYRSRTTNRLTYVGQYREITREAALMWFA